MRPPRDVARDVGTRLRQGLMRAGKPPGPAVQVGTSIIRSIVWTRILATEYQVTVSAAAVIAAIFGVAHHQS